MATATMFDEWDDVGLAFTDDQLKGCDPRAVAAARANTIIDWVPAVQRRAMLRTLPVWWDEVAKRMETCALYYLWRIDAPRLDVAALNEVVRSADASELKKLTLRAHRLGSNEQEFVNSWRATLVGDLRTHVTLGRRCAASRAISGWKHTDKSLSNKVGYALLKEMLALDTLETLLHAVQVGGAEEGD